MKFDNFSPSANCFLTGCRIISPVELVKKMYPFLIWCTQLGKLYVAFLIPYFIIQVVKARGLLQGFSSWEIHLCQEQTSLPIICKDAKRNDIYSIKTKQLRLLSLSKLGQTSPVWSGNMLIFGFWRWSLEGLLPLVGSAVCPLSVWFEGSSEKL